MPPIARSTTSPVRAVLVLALAATTVVSSVDLNLPSGALGDSVVPPSSIQRDFLPSSPDPSPKNGDIRLSGGYQGQLRVYYNGQYGAVCDDRFTDTAAKVVCRQLGLSGGQAVCCGEYGPGSGPMLLDEVKCLGNETRLEQCSHNGWGQHDCGPEEAVGVVCSGAEDASGSPPTPSDSTGGLPAPSPEATRNLTLVPSVDCIITQPGFRRWCHDRYYAYGRSPISTDVSTYRVVYAYPDGSRSCPIWGVATFAANYTDSRVLWVQLKSMESAAQADGASVGSMAPEILFQRRGQTSAVNFVGYTWRNWLVSTWTDVYSAAASSGPLLRMYDKRQGYDLAKGALAPAGPIVAGWRWKYGSSGTTDGYIPSRFPELTATSSGTGVNATYQLVYRFLDGYYSYPDPSRFRVTHARASTPLTLYVQLVSGVHPTDMAELLLQRVEGDAVWNVARLGLDSPDIKAGQRALVFADTTSRATWGCPSDYVPQPSYPPVDFAQPPSYLVNEPQQQQQRTPPSTPGLAPPVIARTEAAFPGPSGFSTASSDVRGSDPPGRALQESPPPVRRLHPSLPPAVPRLLSPPASPGPSTQFNCRLVLVGWNGKAYGLEDLQQSPDGGGGALLASTIFQTASLDCWNAGGGSDSVVVEVGEWLAPLLEHSGIQAVKPTGGKNATLAQWGLAFTGVDSLTLLNSVLLDLPLSTDGPLVGCWSCRELNFVNSTLQNLISPLLPAGDQIYAHGAVAATGVWAATFQGFQCLSVTEAHGWGCVLLDMKAPPGLPPAPYLRILNAKVQDILVRPFDVKDMGSATSALLQTARQSAGWSGAGAIAVTYSDQASYALPAFSVSVSDSVFTGNSAGSGAALFSHVQGMDTVATVRSSTFIGNAASSGGGAVRLSSTTDLRIQEGSAVDNNSASNGGAIYIDGNLGSFTLDTGSSLSGNTAGFTGGGIAATLLVGQVSVLNGSSADRNRADRTGGLVMSNGGFDQVWGPTDVLIGGNSSASNNAAAQGAVIFTLWLRSFAVRDFSRVDANDALQYAAVAMAQSLNGRAGSSREALSISVTGYSSMSRNTATDLDVGSGLFFLPDNYTLRRFVVDNNSAVNGNRATNAPVITSCSTIESIVVSGNSSLSFNEADTSQEGNEGGGLFYGTDLGSFLVEGGGRVSGNAMRLAGDGAVVYARRRIDYVGIRGDASAVTNNTAYGGNGGFLGATALGTLEVSGGGSLSRNNARSSNSGNGGAGGAVVVTQSLVAVNVTGGNVADNTATLSGGAIYVAQDVTGDVLLDQSAVVERNRAMTRSGGFLAVGRSMQAFLKIVGGSRLCFCSAAQSGGAVSAEESIHGGLVVATGATACGNAAQAGHGGVVHAGFAINRVLLFGGGSVANNTASSFGGAVFAAGLLANVTVASRGLVTGNRAGSDGGAFYADLISTLRLADGAAAVGNVATGDGGFAFANRISDLAWLGSRLAGNRAGRSGGAVAVPVPPASVLVAGSTLVDNVAERGAGGVLSIVVPQPGSPLLTEAAEAEQLSYRISDGTVFQGNGAYTDGGGISIAAEVPSSPISPKTNKPNMALTIFVSNASFVSNYAGGAGGAISLASPAAGSLSAQVHVHGSRFTGNTAGTDMFRIGSSVSSGYGGAISVISTPKFTADAAMKAARAAALLQQHAPEEEAAGASVSLDTACALRLEQSVFDGNSCQASGGAVAAVSCPSLVTGCTFRRNQARTSGGGLAGLVESIRSTDLEAPDESPTASASDLRRMQQELGASCSAAASGIPLETEWWLDVRNSTFELNAALLDCGGGLYSEAAFGVGSRVTGSTFLSNAAEDRHGGGICVVARGDCAQVALSENQLINNTASRQGGGVFSQLSGGTSNVLVVTGIVLTGNSATQGGAVMVVSAQGSSATLGNVTADRNTAEQDGGALSVVCAAASTADACGSDPIVTLSGSTLTRNAASSGSGGALHVAAGASVAVHDSQLAGNVAGSAGGGVAAVGCGRLMLVGGSVVDGTAAEHGGGVFAHSCSRVLLHGLALKGNRAITGGGAFFAGPSSDVATLPRSDVEAVAPSVMLVGATLLRNQALVNGTDLLVGAEAAGGVYSSGYRRFGGHGGGVFAYGNVSVLVSGSNLATNNSALVGAALGSAQRCDNPEASSAALSSWREARVAAAGSMDETEWEAVAAAGRDRACWPLLLTQVRLPQKEALPIWLQDPSASALQAWCGTPADTAVTASTSPNPTFTSSTSPSACASVSAELRRTCLLTEMLEACAEEPQLEPAGRPETGSLLEVAPTHMRLEAFSGKLKPGAAVSVAARLYNGLNQPVHRDTLSFTVTVSIEPLDPGFNASACALSSSSSAGAAGASASCSGSRLQPQPQRPWQDGRVAYLDPATAQGGALTVPVSDGLAVWPYLTVRGWPGRYVLVFNATATEDAGLYQIAPLRVEAEVTHCQPGEALDTSWAQQPGAQPSWLACTRCGRGRFTFWRDERPSLWEIDQPNYMGFIQDWANAATEGEATCMTCPSHANCLGGALVVPEGGYWHSAQDSALFHRCPGSNACWRLSDGTRWASLPSIAPSDLQVAVRADGSLALINTTSVSSITAADGQQLQTSDATFAALLPAVTSGLDARSGWLALCQQVLYQAMETFPGQSAQANVSEANASSLLPPGDPRSLAELLSVCTAAGLAGGGAQAANSSSGTGPYQQLECGEGYTSHLCAACLPGYYINTEFECRTCPKRNLLFATLAFVASVLLVLGMALTSFTGGTAPGLEDPGRSFLVVRRRRGASTHEEVPFSEFMKVAIVHAQFYIIITRLPVAYPDVISRMQSTLSALTGAENTVAFSYSCLFPEQASDGQARAQLLGTLLVPAVVAATSLVAWVARYYYVNEIRHMKLPRIRLTAKGGCAVAQARRAPGFGNLAAPVVVAPMLTPSTSSGCTSPPLAPSPFLQSAPSVLSSVPSTERDLSRESPTTSRHEVFETPINKRLSMTSMGSASHGSPPSPPSPFRKSLSRLHQAVSTSVRDVKRSMWDLDQALGIRRQLGIVLMIAVFILYPGWAQAALSVFSCYRIDDGASGPFAERQQATWHHGYWVRDMAQECYTGTHLRLYVPIGVVAVLLVCLAPPLASFVLLWRNRDKLDDPGVQQRFGFLFTRYKKEYYWWESVLMLEELGLVAVEVFGRALPAVSHQVLMMLAAFIVLSAVNMSCAPVKSRLIALLEFLSLCVLSLTITLSLYFVVDYDLDAFTANAIGTLIIAINIALLFGFAGLLMRRYWGALGAAGTTLVQWFAPCIEWCRSMRAQPGRSESEQDAWAAPGMPALWPEQTYGPQVVINAESYLRNVGDYPAVMQVYKAVPMPAAVAQVTLAKPGGLGKEEVTVVLK